MIRWKFNGGVKFTGSGINPLAMRRAQVNFTQPGHLHLLSPDGRGLFCARQIFGSKNQEKRLAVYAYITAVFKGWKQVPNEVAIVFGRIWLRNQDFILGNVPGARPVMIGPAEAKWEIRAAAAQHFIERALQKTPPAEPVMVITKSVHAVFPGQFSLLLSRFRDSEVIKTEVGGQMRLVMSF